MQPIWRERQTVQNKHCPSKEGQSKLRGAAQVFPYPVTSSWPQHRARASLAYPGSVRASEQKCLDTTWFTENNNAITCSTLRWGCSCKQHFWLCLKKKKKIETHLCVTGINPQAERLLTLVAYHNRVVTEGLRPSQGNYISHILSEKKFISSCNEFKTNYCHHS